MNKFIMLKLWRILIKEDCLIKQQNTQFLSIYEINLRASKLYLYKDLYKYWSIERRKLFYLF